MLAADINTSFIILPHCGHFQNLQKKISKNMFIPLFAPSSQKKKEKETIAVLAHGLHMWDK